MKILNYIARAVLSLTMVAHGVQKFLVREVPKEPFREMGMKAYFIDFYTIMEQSGYMLAVGALQVVIALFLAVNRTHLLGAIMLFPMMAFLVGIHIFLSGSMVYILFDTALLGLTILLMWQHYRKLIPLIA